jgi:ATP-dependent exoDNAse (exonuclease V) beta subunit
MTDPRPVDFDQRQAAIDPRCSFIVQAPAGSGKTGLLTQRFLKLLTTVENPEEIIAITFTRKAAAEMRQRVLSALINANGNAPEQDFEKQTWRLARAAIRHAESRDWKLLDNPQRLRIRTIDSLCQYIGRQLPLASGFGEVPDVTENARSLYLEAAESVFAELESESGLASALRELLPVLDNNPGSLRELIADMLDRRDQWLRHIFVRDDRETRKEIERALKAVVERALDDLIAIIPQYAADQIPRLARFAADNLDPGHALAACRNMDALPGSNASDLRAWQSLASLLLTTSGDWRKSRGVNVRIGFPATHGGIEQEMKSEITSLLDNLQDQELFRCKLSALDSLPQPFYSDREWKLLQALFVILQHAVSHLKWVFSQHGVVDFCETALAADTALKDQHGPTELAMKLDYRIRHLLVDEFQDTSQNQYNLIRNLTEAWEPGDGRSLFLVGDPMQSIYGFREAEVGLFLDAWKGFLGSVPLKRLRLSVNFRSDKGIIDWVNEQFPTILPEHSDPAKAAVSYAPSEAFHPAQEAHAVRIHPFICRDDEAEANQILQIIRETRKADPNGTTAILVRSKSHLAAIVEKLREEKMRFQAVEIGELQNRPVVMDLVSLTNALLHRGDRVSWLAVLHSPLCGLSLEDMHTLVGSDHDATVFGLMCDDARTARMSSDGRKRVADTGAVFRHALAEQGRRSLRDWVEGVWFALGGPLALNDEASCNDVEVYFQLLNAIEESGREPGPEVITEEVEKLFSQPDPLADESLQLMTMHKAKGLEFDTVILPGLGKSPRGDRQKLLYWLETAGTDAVPDIFFGPVKSRNDKEESSTSQFIRKFESQIQSLESGRLLYVAATRARKRLHLFGHAEFQKNAQQVWPRSASLLAQMWPALGRIWTDKYELSEPEQEFSETDTVAIPRAPQAIIPSGWKCPDPPADAQSARPQNSDAGHTIEFAWAGDTARAIGIVVHRFFQYLVESRTECLGEVDDFESTTRKLLSQEGVLKPDIDAAMSRVRSALENSLEDETGRWILSADHDDSKCELAITAVLEGEVRHLVIDRTFVDEGVRWIIDYKTGTHSGGNIEGFLDEEEKRYGPQLERYAQAFRKLEDRPVKTALYYPLIKDGWRVLGSETPL